MNVYKKTGKFILDSVVVIIDKLFSVRYYEFVAKFDFAQSMEDQNHVCCRTHKTIYRFCVPPLYGVGLLCVQKNRL